MTVRDLLTMSGGHDIEPKEWILRATRKQVLQKQESHAQIGIGWQQGYGFQFWRCRHDAYRGDGAGDQFCVIMPDQGVVVALTSGGADMQAELNAIWDHLLNAVQALPLPEDAAGRDKVNQLVASLEVHPAKTDK